MIKHIPKKKIEFFQHAILEWYHTNGRKFYWRKKGLSNYQLVIAEVLLQRTKAETVCCFLSKLYSRISKLEIFGKC
jgi:A/G-specific adenine glycosylase